MEKRELLRPVVFVGNTVARLGHLVVKPFEGGWVNFGKETIAEPTPAKITILNSPNQVDDPREKDADL